MPFFPARDGQSLHVRTLGRGQPVLMLHGLGMQGRDWLPFVLPYAREFQFYLPDLRGAGRSARVRFNQADVFQNHMEDMEDLVRHFGLSPCYLVGYSLGATTSLHWQSFGDFSSVARYLHVDQSPCIHNSADWPHGLFGANQSHFFGQLRALRALLDGAPDQGEVVDLAVGLRERVLHQLVDILSQISGNDRLKNAFAASARWAGVWARLLPVSNIADIRAYLDAYLDGAHDYRDSARDFPVPATVLTGALSPLYPAEGQAAFAQLAGAEHVVLPRSGHVPLMSQPVEFTRALGRFLKGG
ncbi:MAG: alpha/beta hydrolase [Pseudomonadota bacterium]|uniref:alpha/beta fold hydrolase n=1 Tax=Alcanivorax sp. TaxID=1872427 RepID=UPI00243C8742|nr:alpha/beta hydrolase [Alcanivorax sp.]MEE3320704.1 alpha/beta hydrolase [Pseudomonadota bacterium]